MGDWPKSFSASRDIRVAWWRKGIDSFSLSFSTRDQAVFKQLPLIAIARACSQASLKKYGSHGRPVVTSSLFWEL